MINNGGLRIIPCPRPLEMPRLSGSAVFVARLWELQSAGISNALTPRLLQAAGIAKTLTQASYLNTVTSLADRGNLKNTDAPRSLFRKIVLIDISDISPFQTFINRNRPQPFHPPAQTGVSWAGQDILFTPWRDGHSASTGTPGEVPGTCRR